MTSLLDAPLAFVDVETTGGHPLYHRVIEIGVVLAHGDEHEESWSTLVNPGARLPPSIQRLTGIDPASLEDAPRFAGIADEVAARLGGRLFVAHNARFDYGFVRRELQRTGRAFDARLACTVKLSRRFYPELPRHNLDAVIAHHDLPCAARHRALPDAMALWQFWRRLRETWPHDALEAALDTITRRVPLPPQLPPELADELPQSAGVYRFYRACEAGERESLLYVGRAVDLRERVLGHWRAALLLETRCVREERPVYNRALRGGGEALTWQLSDTGAMPRLCTLDDGWPAGDCFGLYRTEREARRALEAIARAHGLCAKVLGLEAGEGSCIAYQVQRCRGACVEAEPRERHLARTKLALAAERLKPWPYEGAVAIRERAFGGFEQWHVIDGWRYLGTLTRHEGAEEGVDEDCGGLRAKGQGPEALVELRAAPRFDVDAYRVLTRYFATHPSGAVPWPPRGQAWPLHA